jgi:hypothetical protein
MTVLRKPNSRLMIRSEKAHKPPRTILLDSDPDDCKDSSTVLAPSKCGAFWSRYLIFMP